MSEPRIDLAMRAAAEHLGVPLRDLMSPSRKAPLAWARHVAMWAVREATGASLPRLGRAFGGRDHTTVLYGVRRVEEARHWPKIRHETDLVREAVEDRLWASPPAPGLTTPRAEATAAAPLRAGSLIARLRSALSPGVSA